MTFQDKLNIAHIEQYEFCPKQAENSMNNVPDLYSVSDLKDGSEAHKERAKKFISQSFRATIQNQQGKEREPSRIKVKEAILWTIKNHSSKAFVEVFVESQKYGIIGYCDEVKIDKGEVSIIEYKTSWNWLKTGCPSPPICQAKAYAQAFKEYFEYDKPIKNNIRRVFLKISKHFPMPKENPEKPALICEERSFINGGWWEGIWETIYDNFYNPDDFDYVKSIIDKIRRKDFTHNDSLPRCLSCQYRLTCDDAIMS